jgi:transcriptional regulator with XRE-family HTH domain
LTTFGDNVKRLRLAAGFKRAKHLAEAIEVAGSVVSRWENNKASSTDSGTLIKLAKTLGCSVGDLLRGVDAEYDQLCHSADQSSTPLGGVGVDTAAQARRIAELERSVTDFEARWRDVQDVAKRLFSIAIGDEDRTARKGAARRRRSSRATG